jgi:hypothetical protein
MPVCQSCDQPSLDPSAQFCAYCGAGLTGSGGFAAATTARPSSRVYTSRASQGIPVAVALAALTLGVLVAIAMSGTSPSRAKRGGPTVVAGLRHAAPSIAPVAETTVRVGTPDHRLPAVLAPLAARPAAYTPRYSGGSFALGYPRGWSVAKRNQPVANYAETLLQSSDTTAKVTVDHTAGEVTDPAAKAAQVEAATSRTPGYRRVAVRQFMLGGRSAVEWVFALAGATYPQRTDIFVNTGHDGFAFLAYGSNYAGARAAARAIAASVAVKG